MYVKERKKVELLEREIKILHEGDGVHMGLDELRKKVTSEKGKIETRYKAIGKTQVAIWKTQVKISELEKVLERLARDRMTAEETLEEVRKAMQGAKNDLLTLARLRKGLGNNAPVTIGRNLIENYRKAETAEDRRKAADVIVDEILKQIPYATPLEKLDAIRHIHMLFNVKTPLRNIIGNVSNLALLKMSDQIAVPLDAITAKFSKNGYERTKAASWEKLKYSEGVDSYFKAIAKKYARRAGQLLHPIKTVKGLYNNSLHENDGSTVLRFLERDADEMQKVLQGKTTTGKQGEDILEMFEERRRIFKNGFLEWERKTSRDLLETPDLWFLRSAYKDALLSTLTARGIDISDLESTDEGVRESAKKALDSAREYAIRRAHEATFREKNRMAKTMQDMKKTHPIARLLIDSVFPYIKTPANVARQAAMNSPVGLIKAAYDSVKPRNAALKRMRIAATEEARASTDAQKARAAEARADAERDYQRIVQKTIEETAQGTTGTALAVIGYMLSKGVEVFGKTIKIRFGGGDDDDYEDLLGLQDLSVVVDLGDGHGVSLSLSRLRLRPYRFSWGALFREKLDKRTKEQTDDTLGWLCNLAEDTWDAATGVPQSA